MKKIFIQSLLILSVLGFQCTKGPVSKTSSTGRTSEIMVICEDKYWNGDVGDSIRNFFKAPQEALPQGEAKFLLVHFRPSSFKSYIRKHRNIFIVEFNTGRREPKIEMKKDVWAVPQMVIKLTLRNVEQFVDVFDSKKAHFESYFHETERLRIIRAYKRIQEPKIRNKLNKKWAVSLVIPQGFYIASEDDHNMWLRKELAESSQGLFIHEEPYVDSSVFNLKSIIAIRDSLLKLYIPGPDRGTYMTTEKLFPPIFSKANIDGNYTIETRGLWKVEGMFYGGGPFVNYFVVDEKKNRLFIIDGYVFAPKDDKRDFLLQVESIIYSLKFINNE